MNSLATVKASHEKLKPLLQLALQFGDRAPASLTAQERASGENLRQLARKASRDLASLFIKFDCIEDAGALLKAIVALDPADGDAWMKSGEISFRQGDYPTAAACFAKALELSPGNADLHCSLGRTLLKRGLRQEAKSSFENAISRDPAHYASLIELSMIALYGGNSTEAATCIDRALAIQPDGVAALINAAQLNIGIGNTALAQDYLSRLLASHPDHVDAHFLMAKVKTYSPADSDVAVLDNLWAERQMGDAQRARVGFALFKALDDTGAHEQAFDVLLKANSLRRQAFPDYRLSRDLDLMESLKHLFTPDFTASCQGAGICGYRPVFIVGLPRSGTTLTEQILASHSQVHACGELDLMSSLVKRFFLDGGRLKDPDQILPRAGANIAAMAKAYLTEVAEKQGSKTRFTDKMPVNFLWAGFIRLMFPDARIIHMQRDRIANGFALFSTYFDSAGMQYSYDLDEIGPYMSASGDLMDHWRRLFPGNVLDVSYEALTEDLDAQARRILKFCNLDWEENCLEFHKTKRMVLTLSAAQVIKPIYSGIDRRTIPYRHLLSSLEMHESLPVLPDSRSFGEPCG